MFICRHVVIAVCQQQLAGLAAIAARPEVARVWKHRLDFYLFIGRHLVRRVRLCQEQLVGLAAAAARSL